MRKVAERLGVSPDAVTYFMRRNNLPRRNFSQINADRFAQKPPSFKIRPDQDESLRSAGIALYWAEGYKSEKGCGVDFANSDPEMINVFMKFLRNSFELDESRLRVLLYCYSDQNISFLIRFWSKLTRIPEAQFTKPYVRREFRLDGRKMPYGLIHVRYSDKKLLLAIKGLIREYQQKFAQVVP